MKNIHITVGTESIETSITGNDKVKMVLIEFVDNSGVKSRAFTREQLGRFIKDLTKKESLL